MEAVGAGVVRLGLVVYRGGGAVGSRWRAEVEDSLGRGEVLQVMMAQVGGQGLLAGLVCQDCVLMWLYLEAMVAILVLHRVPQTVRTEESFL